MKPLVIYHASCADGFGAAFAAWLKLGDEAEYVPMQYGKIDFDFEGGFFNLGGHEADNPCMFIAGREVYILDFSFPREAMDQVFRRAKRVVWLDHHKSAFEMWCAPHLKDSKFFINQGDVECGQKDNYILLDNNKSGAYLAWEYFHPGTEVPMMIRHIDDYDRWVFAIEGTKAFQKALWGYAPWSFQQWSGFLFSFESPKLQEQFRAQFYGEGNAILRAHNQNVQSVVKGAARKCCIKVVATEPTICSEGGGEYFESLNLPGLAANCPPHLQSDVGHELTNQSGTFGLLWYIDKDNVCKCSLRSNGDYDVSAIARAFGGGGHRNAAGFTTDIQTLLDWIK